MSEQQRELPEGVSRKQVRTIDPVRQYVLDQTAGSTMTVSEYLKTEVFPDDWESVHHGYEDEDMVRMKVTPEVDGMVDHMTGGRVNKGEVIAFYLLLDAIRKGETEVAQELLEYSPELHWEETGE